MTPLPGMVAGPGFADPAVAVERAGDTPILLTRVGREHPGFVPGVDTFLAKAAAAGSTVEIIEAPEGHHSFDIVDHTDESRAAVRRAVDWVYERQAV